jgi:hypothetical protein
MSQPALNFSNTGDLGQRHVESQGKMAVRMASYLSGQLCCCSSCIAARPERRLLLIRNCADNRKQFIKARI